jgi:hypothetical protein
MTTEANDNQALVLQFSADNAKMLRAFEQTVNKIGGYADQIERRAKKMGEKVEEHGRFAGEGFGKAFERVFQSSRLTVLEEGSARLSVFGGALEALGPLGLAGAAGVGAFFLTMEHTEKAVEYAATIAKIGKEVGVTTDFIQKFNFAAHQNEIDVTAADAALKSLNTTLGTIQEGGATAKQIKPFIALGFGKDAAEVRKSLDQYHDIGDFLPVLADRIAKVGNAAEQAAILKKMGGEELLVLLKDGAAGFDTLAKKAEALGIVMDHATIEKAEAAKRKLTELDDVMKAKANISFAEFADTLVKVKEAFLGAETAGLRFLSLITGTESAKDKLKDLVQGEQSLLKEKDYANNPVARQLFAHYHAEIQQLLAQQGKEKPEEVASARDKVKQLIPDAAKKKAAQADPTAGFDKAALDAYYASLAALTKAQAALLVDVEARAEAEKKAVDDGLKKKLADIEFEAQKIAKDKNDTDKLAQRAKLNSAKSAEQDAAAAQKALIDRQTAEALRKQQEAYDQQQLDGQAQQLGLELQLTFSQQLRQKYALQLVDLAFQKTKAELEGVLASQTATAADKKLARLKLQQLDAEQGLRVEDASRNGSAPAQHANDIVAGIKQKASAADDAAQAFAEIDRLRKKDVINEQEAAQAKAQISAEYDAQRLSNAQTFFGDLARLSQSGNRTLAGIGKAAAIAQATIDGILAVQKALASAPPPFNFALAAAAGVAAAANVAKIAGLADGGAVTGPGGPRDDKVLRWLSNGEHVVNTAAASRPGVRPVLDALNAGRDLRGLLPSPPSISPAGGLTVIQPLYLNAQGAMTTQEFMEQVNTHANRAAASAAQAARAGAVSDVQRASYLNNLNSGG